MAKQRSTQLARYLIGIDLGTTHTAIAYLDTDNQEQGIQLFQVPQLVAAGEVAEQALFPSTRYHPADSELALDDCGLPWQAIHYGDPVKNPVLGSWARLLGAKSHGRQVTSAKSWLSNSNVDRTAAILPWGAPEGVEKISPMLASASYLNHLRCAWNLAFPDYPIEQQDVVLTIPASFDEDARQYTLAAAHKAGFPKVRLLEEPLAASYDWTYQHRAQIKQELADINLVLVCDVGGGTTDFSLLQVKPGKVKSSKDNQDPQLERIGVGDHLMLGGDNIDLALARIIETRLAEQASSNTKPLSSAELYQLIEQCRQAKEQLLSADAPQQATVALLGSGSSLIGKSRSATLSRTEVRALVTDGFFPGVALQTSERSKRSGVVEFGLAYESEPAITRHIADFLLKHQRVSAQALGVDAQQDVAVFPQAVLLNGGVFRSQLVVKQLLSSLENWSQQPIRLLQNKQPELAVAYGAVAYGLARRGQHLKIGGGSARSFFLLVDDALQSEQRQGVCVLPKGTEEGQALALEGRSFALQLGQPVRFHLVSTSEDSAYKPGQLVPLDGEHFHSLPPLVATLDQQNDQQQRRQATIHLSAELDELGVLALSCIDADDAQRRWLLNFELRAETTTQLQHADDLPVTFADASALISSIYGKKSKDISPKAVKMLRNDLEKLLGKREDWDSVLLRALHDQLLGVAKNRRRSANHERLWLSLIGFCLRPGYGDPLDDWRCEQLWALKQHSLQFVNETQHWIEWWTMWRRVAGGLNAEQQLALYQDVAKYIDPASARQGKTAEIARKRGYDEMVRMVAVLELLPLAEKVRLGGWLLKRLQKAGESSQSWWALGRIASRIPQYASSHAVVDVQTVELWLDALLKADWKKHSPIAFAAVLMSRKSGDRARDISPHYSQAIIQRLQQHKAPESWINMIEKVVELDAAEQRIMFGESLPSGLRLLD